MNRVEDRIDGAVAGRLMRLLLAVDFDGQRRRLRAACAGNDGEAHELDPLMRMDDLIVDERDQILVVDDLLAVGEILETGEGVFERVLAELIAELLQFFSEGMAARMLAHDERSLGDADTF